MMRRLETKQPMLLLFLILSTSVASAKKVVAGGPVVFVADSPSANAAATQAYDDSAMVSQASAGLAKQQAGYPIPTDPYASAYGNLQTPTTSPNMMTALAGPCIMGVMSLLNGNKETTTDLKDVSKRIEAQSDSPYSNGNPDNPFAPGGGSRSIPVENATMSMTCDRFIDANGNYGDWGRSLATQLHKHNDAYFTKVPTDMSMLCPKFSSFDVATKEKFWVHAFASMASNESGCNASNRTAENQGLLQLDEGACGKFVNLYNTDNNLACGANQLAKELANRDTLTKNCSRCEGGTYWAVLRSDGTPLSPDTSMAIARAREVSGSLKTQKLIKSFSPCN